MSRARTSRWHGLCVGALGVALLLVGCASESEQPEQAEGHTPIRESLDLCNYAQSEIVDPAAVVANGKTLDELMASIDGSRAISWVGWDGHVTWPTAPQGDSNVLLEVTGGWREAYFYESASDEFACPRILQFLVPLSWCTEDGVICSEADALASFDLVASTSILWVTASTEDVGLELAWSEGEEPDDAWVELWMSMDALDLGVQGRGGIKLVYYWDLSTETRFGEYYEVTDLAELTQP